MSRTHREIIALWDSLSHLAADTGASLVSVRKWYQRGIPAARFGAVLRTGTAQSNGVTLEELEMGERPKKAAA